MCGQITRWSSSCNTHIYGHISLIFYQHQLQSINKIFWSSHNNLAMDVYGLANGKHSLVDAGARKNVKLVFLTESISFRISYLVFILPHLRFLHAIRNLMKRAILVTEAHQTRIPLATEKLAGWWASIPSKSIIYANYLHTIVWLFERIFSKSSRKLRLWLHRQLLELVCGLSRAIAEPRK